MIRWSGMCGYRHGLCWLTDPGEEGIHECYGIILTFMLRGKWKLKPCMGRWHGVARNVAVAAKDEGALAGVVSPSLDTRCCN